jgi:hypothetical protein
MNSLVEFWRACNLGKPPYIHPKDKRELGPLNRYFDESNFTFDTFVSSDRFGDFITKRFHLSLLPSPYAGSVHSADIFVVQLNPGFNYSDYYAEYRNAAFHDRKKKTLLQETGDFEYPVIFLDPQFCWHPGFSYWEGKFRKIISEFAKRRDCSYLLAQKELSTRLAILELVPYHSENFKPDFKDIKRLPSVRRMIDFVHELVGRALKGEITLIVLRKGTELGLATKRPNLIVLGRYQAQGANLTMREDGTGPGDAVLMRLMSSN